MNKVRINGIVLLIIGMLITVGIIGLANFTFGEGNWNFIGYGFAIPGAIALVGLIQVVSGVPFGELAARWDSLAGWQRGIMGTLFVLIACGIIIGGLLIFAMLMYE